MTTLHQDPYRSYQAVNVGAQTAQASPVQLVLMLMSALHDELARARAHIEGKRFEAKAKSIERCANILRGLASALDMESGGEVVQQLAELYDYCVRRLYLAGHRLDAAIVDEVIGLLQTIEGGWRGVQVRYG
ncbi:MAG TPA: flagellar export chaperone FliS [Burkholderiaceae bacterium]|nr:flagellar export chaperone FliS [Burkholderiaceae bacterium]